MSRTLLPIFSLSLRELKRFYRQRSRIVGTLGTPLLFWIFLGTGLGAAFGMNDGKSFIETLFPGNILLSVLFTAIFSTITVIEDRKEGFLQAVLVAPVSPFGLVGGKVVGGALIATLQGFLFLLLAPVAGISLSFMGMVLALIALFFTAIALTALGFFFAWWFDSVQGFHSVMNLILFPMWLMSGAFFPVTKLPPSVQPLVFLNPMTYGMSALTGALYHGTASVAPFPYVISVSAILVFAVLFQISSMWLVTVRRKEVAEI